MAVQYLDAVVTRVRGMLTTDWSVLQVGTCCAALRRSSCVCPSSAEGLHVSMMVVQSHCCSASVLHVQWVVRYSAGELHKFSKCLYELEQDDLIQHLVVSA
jgi:hypothetical protein